MSMCSVRAGWQMQDAFVFTKTQYYLSSDWGAGMERGSLEVWGWPPRDGNPQATPGLSVSEITWVPLEFFHPNLCSFLTNTIKLILSWKGAFKKLPFLLVERRVSNSFTSSPKTTAQTCAASRRHLVFKRYLRFSVPTPWLYPWGQF